MYKALLKILLLFSISFISGVANNTSNNRKIIIIGESKSLESANLLKKQAIDKIMRDPILSKLHISKSKMPRVFKELDDYIVVFGPFENSERLKVIFSQTKNLFPHAIIFSLALSSSIRKEVVYKTIEKSVQNEDLELWIGVFLLAFVGILGLFFSSLQISKIIRQNKLIRKRQEEMERRQHELFSRLGENIYSMSKDVIENTEKAISDIGDDVAPKELKQVVVTENKILDTTNNLLEFLKIKAKKIKIEHKQFKINNLLDDVVGSFVGRYPHSDLELVLDIDHALPIYAIGDFTNIVNVLRNLIEHQFSLMREGEVVLSVMMYKTYEDTLELQMKITPYGKMRREDITGDNYFIPDTINSNDVDSTHNRINLFVAYELVSLMKGDIVAQRLPEGGAIIDLSIPVEGIKEERRKYRLPSKKYTQKSVYIVNHHYHASLAQENLFEYFRHKVKIDTEENFLKDKPNLSEYDIVLIDSELIYKGFDVYIEMLRDKYGVKTVCMDNILKGTYQSPYAYMFDKSVMKPLNQEHVFLLIKSLYSEEIRREFGDGEEDKDFKREFIADVLEKPNVKVDDLAKFKGAKILIVEDNEINQRMISTVLDRAGIISEIASNGEEAVEKIEMNGPKYYDLVLMDINMPIMDGFTATKRIREIEGAQKLPIISLTALVLEHEIERMKEAGMDAFLPKPINVGKIYTIFELFLGDKKSEDGDSNKSQNYSNMSFEGLDIKRGLETSGNNPIFYRELLKEFLEVYGESGKAAQSLYEQDRLEAIKQLMLDVMGVSGSIGAKELYMAANEVYKLYLYNKLSLLPGFLKKYNEEMERVKESINKYLEQQQ